MRYGCGTNVILSDDWEGHPQYLELVTREPHRCPHNPMFAPKFESNYEFNEVDFNPNNEIFKIFKGKQNKDALTFLHHNLERYAKLILELEERKHHDIAAKCKPCRYKDQCKFNLDN